ncbi:DUF7662 domain-containing protein [Rhizorhabdus argentea]|uniref:DUF7662 domain-containing protein n=1 Tax=Rhizorhabdus argentea TaxID=1387174 RepID=UPI0030EDD3E8
MAKYDALERHLSLLSQDEWFVDFDEIEKVLGFCLPASASRYPAWWANQSGAGHSQSQSWQAAGWQTSELDLSQRKVRFRRMPAMRGRDYPSAAAPALSSQRLFEDARRYSGIENDEDLVREGMRALIEREAARRLAEAGGTMPEFSAPPRRRGE